jgi:hypothetical protein
MLAPVAAIQHLLAAQRQPHVVKPTNILVQCNHGSTSGLIVSVVHCAAHPGSQCSWNEAQRGNCRVSWCAAAGTPAAADAVHNPTY